MSLIGRYALFELREHPAGATAEEIARALRGQGFEKASRPLVETLLRKRVRQGACRVVDDGDGDARFLP